jgi:hypothetical protein
MIDLQAENTLDARSFVKNTFNFEYSGTPTTTKNIFSSYYNFFLTRKAEGPIYTTVNLLAIALSVWSLFIGLLIKRYNGFNFFLTPYFAFFYIVFMLLLIFSLYKYYTREKEMVKINNRVKVFNTKTKIEKFLWDTISFTFLILPIVLTAILLSK